MKQHNLLTESINKWKIMLPLEFKIISTFTLEKFTLVFLQWWVVHLHDLKLLYYISHYVTNVSGDKMCSWPVYNLISYFGHFCDIGFRYDYSLSRHTNLSDDESWFLTSDFLSWCTNLFLTVESTLWYFVSN